MLLAVLPNPSQRENLSLLRGACMTKAGSGFIQSSPFCPRNLGESYDSRPLNQRPA
jgi:hypothetical protein